jgi:hypothetical protein
MMTCKGDLPIPNPYLRVTTYSGAMPTTKVKHDKEHTFQAHVT